MQAETDTLSTKPASTFRTLLPIIAALFVGFLMVGMPLPVIPLHVYSVLGFGHVAVGVMVGAQFVASLLSRPLAGAIADSRGAKFAVVGGFGSAAIAGLLYLASLPLIHWPFVSYGVLMLGRAFLGCAESLVATGSLAWGVGRAGPARAGAVMVWVGNAIFAAWGLGAPIGSALYGRWGLAGVGIAATLVAMAAMLVLRPVPNIVPPARARAGFMAMMRKVAWPGAGLALASTGFGSITAFVALYFAARQWGGAAYAFSAFGLAFIGARLLFGGLPDRIGGARVARVAVAVGVLGAVAIALAPVPAVAFVGAALVGAGYSLAFPAFGVEAVRRAPPESRGMAMGAYVLFLDIALGLWGPVAGYVAGVWNLATVYGLAAVVMAGGVLVAQRLLMQDRIADARATSP